jgi:hypothetical protein
MKKASLFLAITVFFASIVACGCDVKVESPEEHYHNENEELGSSWRGTCEPYCSYLEQCGVISTQGYQKCETDCRSHFYKDPEQTKQACGCAVADDSCAGLENIDSCTGLPWPYGGSGSAGVGSTGGSGGTAGQSNQGGSAGSSPSSCTVNHDCQAGQDCISGSCLDRCKASCGCGEGLVCEQGYCRHPEQGTQSCEVDCDCPSGQVCTQQWCSAPLFDSYL